MKKEEKCKCDNYNHQDSEFCDCGYDCECSTKNKIIKIGACIGGIAILGGIITSLILKNKKENY